MKTTKTSTKTATETKKTPPTAKKTPPTAKPEKPEEKKPEEKKPEKPEEKKQGKKKLAALKSEKKTEKKPAEKHETWADVDGLPGTSVGYGDEECPYALECQGFYISFDQAQDRLDAVAALRALLDSVTKAGTEELEKAKKDLAEAEDRVLKLRRMLKKSKKSSESEG
jgi:hypothetical protein